MSFDGKQRGRGRTSLYENEPSTSSGAVDVFNFISLKDIERNVQNNSISNIVFNRKPKVNSES